MPEISRLTQKLYAGVLIDMYDLNLSAKGGPTIMFTNWTREDGTWIRWRGNEYQPVAIDVTGYELNGEGKPTRPQMIVGNSNAVYKATGATLMQLCDQFDNFIGCTLTRWRTYRQFLDDGETPDPSTHLPTDPYKVNTMLEASAVSMKWELGVRYDQPGLELPKGVMTQKYCPLEYRQFDPVSGGFDYRFATCPYQGSAYFDEAGNPVSSPAEDKPSKRVDTCCRKRFGTTAPLPTGAFPGMIRLTRRS